MIINKYSFLKRYRFLRTQYSKVDFNDKGLLYFTLITMVAVGIFIPIRWMQGEVIQLVVNIITTAIALVVHILLILGYRNVSRAIFVTLMVAILLILIQYNGAAKLNWVYPGGAMLFFSLKPKSALLVCSLLLVVIGSMVWQELAFTRWLQDMVSLIGSCLIVYSFCNKVERHIEHLNSESLTDVLSGLNNRRSFDHEMRRVKKLKIPCYLLIIDIDFFKKINDQYGHAVGDSVIKHLSVLLKNNLRDDERIFRIGGEEFAVTIESKSYSSAKECAERIRKIIEVSSVTTHAGENISYTVSIGASLYIDDEMKWFRQADRALYKAKNTGRNKVQFAGD